jgi:hypothetical protein
MRVIACLAAHYGKEYLAWVTKSLQEVVDQIHVFYTKSPSYGFNSEGLICPDTEEELHAEAARFLHNRGILYWHRVTAISEAEHRAFLQREASKQSAEIYVVVDSDEIWKASDLQATVKAIYDANRAHRWLTNFANFWKSFDWMVDDEFQPIRFVDMRQPAGSDARLTAEQQPGPIYHFGYAQSEKLMRYKMACHGHKLEFRPHWLETKFFGWKPGDTDTHPCVKDLWTPRRTDEKTRAILRELLPDHPYQELSVIP